MRMEVLYRFCEEEGEKSGRLTYEQSQSLPINWLDHTAHLLSQVVRMKTSHSSSVADVYIAAKIIIDAAKLLNNYPECLIITDLAA